MQLKKISVLFFVLIFFSLPIAVAGEAMQTDYEMRPAPAPAPSLTHLIGNSNIPDGFTLRSTNDPWNLCVRKMGEYNISVSAFGTNTNYDANLNNTQATELSDPSTFAYLDQCPLIHTKLTRIADLHPLSDKPIKFYCDENYLGDDITNSTGVATYAFNKTLSLGNHSLKVYFPGDDHYNSSMNFGTLDIYKIPTYLSDPSATCTYSDLLSVSTRLTDYQGNGIEDKTLYFRYDHRRLGNDVTDEEGYAEITMSDCDINPDKYDLIVEFHGDDRHVESLYIGYLDISKMSTSLSDPSTRCRSGKDVTIETCLEDAHGNGVSGKSVTFNYSNGKEEKIGEDETNSRGYASVGWYCELLPDRYVLKVDFEEDDYYEGSSCEGTLRIR